MLTGVPVQKSICDESSNSALPVCQDGVRNWERREEAEGGAWGPRDSRAEIRFMTEASGADGLAWCRPVSNSPDRPFAKEIKLKCIMCPSNQKCKLEQQTGSDAD